MAYDEDVADRVHAVLAELDVASTEQKMFGGVAFMVGGHMTVGVIRDQLMVRVGKDAHDDAIRLPHAREMDFTGKPMTGMVYVSPAGFEDEDDLRSWVRRGLDFTSTLPPK